MWRALASNMLTFLVVGAFLFAGLLLWGQSQYTGNGPLAQAICLRVERGSNMSRVSRDLETEGADLQWRHFPRGRQIQRKTGRPEGRQLSWWNRAAPWKGIVDQITRGGCLDLRHGNRLPRWCDPHPRAGARAGPGH